MKAKFSANTAIGLVATTSLILIAVFVVSTAQPAPSAMAREQRLAVPHTHSVTVVGEGTVSIQPDIATASIGVEVVRPTVKEASAAARSIMEKVQAALLSQNINGALC